jgi:hypothetical protein
MPEWRILHPEDITQDTALCEDYGELRYSSVFDAGVFGANPPTPLSSAVSPAGSNNTRAKNSKSWSIFTHNTLEVARWFREYTSLIPTKARTGPLRVQTTIR